MELLVQSEVPYGGVLFPSATQPSGFGGLRPHAERCGKKLGRAERGRASAVVEPPRGAVAGADISV